MTTALVSRFDCAIASDARAESATVAATNTRPILRGLVAAIALWSAGLTPVLAQASARELPVNVFVGTETENYLRYLQTLGVVPLYPWSNRMFSREALARLTPVSDSSPWSAVPALHRRVKNLGPVRGELAPMTADLWYNTGFPFGYNDGAVWQGRGATVAFQGGGSLAWGPLTLVVAPAVFWAQNSDFPLAQHDTTLGAYSAALVPGNVDRPQRFGNTSYGRVDPGQSTLRLSTLGVEAGVSTANRWWGPMSEFPYILGNNAAGFPHVFFGTSSPRNVGIGRFHATVIYGRLDQSVYSPVRTGSPYRFGSGAVIVFEPRPLPGLEVGAARFFHTPWPDSGGLIKDDFTHLFETFIKARIKKVFLPRPDNNQSADNQLASVFARWVLPHSGAEVYAEYGREDHNWNGRDLEVEPDHSAAFGVGVRKAFESRTGIRAVRFETMSYQVSTIYRHRFQGGAYFHGFTRQGHTERGQLLATGGAAGSGAAAGATYEHIEPSSATRWSWYRFVTLDPVEPERVTAAAQQVLRVEHSRSRGRESIRGAAAVIADLNRNLRGGDVLGFRLEFGWRRF